MREGFGTVTPTCRSPSSEGLRPHTTPCTQAQTMTTQQANGVVKQVEAALAASGGEQGPHRALVGAPQAVGAGEGGRIVEVDVLPAEVSRQFIPPSLGGEEELRQGALQGPQQSADAVRSRALARARRPAILEGGEGCAAARSGDREGPAAAASLREQPARRRVMRLLA